MLGSSRKSLADTSVTSTADLSVFSGGQRSQQAFDVCVDDSRSLVSEKSEDEAENQSSSGCVRKTEIFIFQIHIENTDRTHSQMILPSEMDWSRVSSLFSNSFVVLLYFN